MKIEGAKNEFKKGYFPEKRNSARSKVDTIPKKEHRRKIQSSQPNADTQASTKTYFTTAKTGASTFSTSIEKGLTTQYQVRKVSFIQS
ncbi:hypothetical protein F4X33_14740 [Candidatus Poribacteria bacterium]|nr:hypothetical protein [Candidatus Poribacteria bacterium]